MDEIEKILQTTGLSCDELLKKLQIYKTVKINDDNNEKSTLKTDKTCMETVIIQVEKSNSNTSINQNGYSNNKNNRILEKNLQNEIEDQDEDTKNVKQNEEIAQTLDEFVVETKITKNTVQHVDENRDNDDANNVNVEKNENIDETMLDCGGDAESITDTIVNINEDRDKGNDTNKDRDNDNSTNENQYEDNVTTGDRDEDNDTNEDRVEGNDTTDDRLEGKDTNENRVEEEDRDKSNDTNHTNEDCDEGKDTNEDQDDGCSEQENLDDIGISNQSTDDLINNIKLQLLSLRNKKKTNCYISDLHTKINNFPKKHKRIAEIHPSIDYNDQNNDNILQQEKNNSLITTTDETNFHIVNVIGGVDLTKEDNCKKMENLKRKQDENDETNSNLLSDSNFPQVKKIRLPEPTVVNNETTTTATAVEKSGNMDKSPFISDTLENFLNEKQLKISYPIPKLGAEDGLMETMKSSPYDCKNNNYNNNRQLVNFSKKQPPKKQIKARTLAEMRRQFEASKFAENNKENQRNCENKNDKLKKLSRNSYVLYKNKKIWLPSFKQNQCLCKIDDYQTLIRKQKNSTIDCNKNNKKLSLLSTMSQEIKLPKISYKPGPLSKKIHLQSKESCKYWKTEIKKLPKIYFEVIPEINKPINTRFLHLLPVFNDDIITKERADFALSVLKQPGDKQKQQQQQQIFKFPVPYNNNQEEFIVCRPILHKNSHNNDNNIKNCDEFEKNVDIGSDIGIEIKNIIDDMIRYVEIKEISDDLIQDDDDFITHNNNDNNNKDNDNIKQKNFVKKKRKRIDVELQRLNCKIINIENDDNNNNNNNNNDDDQYCNKPYCKLGCICKSLQCEPILLNHCQLLDCMFNCKCPKKQENSLLDEYKMNHLNEQVKKNLAKVEREFTQTIIQQGNEMYVVGNTGDNKKTKRTSKAPKRYHDYDYDFDNKISTTTTITTTPTKKSSEINYNLKECRIDLIKLNLDNVVPFCLQHYNHNCYCNRLLNDKNNKIDTRNKNVEGSARIRPVYSKYRERHKHPIYKSKTFYKKKVIVDKLSKNINNDDDEKSETIFIINDDIQPTTSNNNNNNSNNNGKINKRKQAFEKIREDYSYNNNNNNNRSLISTDAGYRRVFEGEIQVPLKQNLHMLSIIGNKNSHLEYLRILPWNLLIKGYNNYKIKIWCTLGRPYTLLCNKYYSIPPKNCVDINKLSTMSPAPTVKNEIIKWILNNKLPPNRCANKTFAILVPTKNHFSIAGFCERNSGEDDTLTTENLEKIVPTTSPTTPTTTMTTTVPAKIPVKVPSSSSTSSSSTPPSSPKTAAASPAFSSLLSSLSHTSSVLLSTENRGMKWKHKDMNNESQILFITNRHFAPKLFYYKADSMDKLEISLPKVVKSSKWYMIYLKSDFTYLLFKKCNYTIKYTDLLEFINMSKSLQKTIMIRNEKIINNYWNNKKFSIYCVPQFQDRLFIGPFLYDEDHNIDTLRYINGQLYDTNVYRQIQGKIVNSTNPLWIYECKQLYKPNTLPNGAVKEDNIINTTDSNDDNNNNNNNNTIITNENTFSDTTISITNNDEGDDDDVIILEDPLRSTSTTNINSYNEFYDKINGDVFMLPFVKELQPHELKSKAANRYIITNIPYLGYLEAYQYETKIIDVYWPLRIKAYRFINVKFAKHSLIHYFSQIFCPVNEDFKISVVILTEIDPDVNKPIDIKYVIDPGPYICGDFGVYSEETVPKEFLKAHKVSSMKQLLRLEQRTEESFDSLVKLFGLFLMTTKEQQQFKTTKEILDWAISEIYVMKRLSGNYEAEKIDLQYLRRFNFLQIKKMLFALPLEQRRKHYDEIMAIKQSQRLLIKNRASYTNKKQRINEMQVTETIEIKDSDDEDDKYDENNVKKIEENTKQQDGKTDKIIQLAKIGTVVKPVFQQVTSSGIIQKGGSTILNRSILKKTYAPSRTYVIAKKINNDSFKIVNSEIVKNLDNSTKVVNNILTNVTEEIV